MIHTAHTSLHQQNSWASFPLCTKFTVICVTKELGGTGKEVKVWWGCELQPVPTHASGYEILAASSSLQYPRKGGREGRLFPCVSVFLVRIQFWSKVCGEKCTTHLICVHLWHTEVYFWWSSNFSTSSINRSVFTYPVKYIYINLLGLAHIYCTDVYVPRWCILMTLVISLFFPTTRLTFVVQNEMSQQLLDGLT